MLRKLSDKTKLPPFRQVSPLVYYSSWAFAVMNLFFLAPTFFFTNGNAGLALVGLVPSQLWGVVFVLLGIVMIVGLIRNNWLLIKMMLGGGLIVKAMFAWALVFTLFASFSNLGIIGVWFGMMVWQGLCIIYFTPEMKHVRLK